MEYSIEKLDEAIFNCLVSTPAEWISVNTIFDTICKNGTCPELAEKRNLVLNKRRFMTECRTLGKKFNKISQQKIGKTLYLRFDVVDLKDEDELLTYEQICEEAKLNLNLTEELLKPFEKENETEKNSTLLHEICRSGNYELLDKIHEYIETNIYHENKLNESLVDVVNLKTENGRKVMDVLLMINASQIVSYGTKISDLKHILERKARETNALREKFDELNFKFSTTTNNNFIGNLLFAIGLLLIGVNVWLLFFHAN